MSTLVTIDRHPAADDPGQPPLSADGPSIHPHANIARSSFGAWTAVGARSSVVESVLGDYSYVVNDAEIIYSTIGKFCSIAAKTRINPGNHPTWRASQHHWLYRAASYGLGQDEAEFFGWRRAHAVEIGHDVWIGHGAVILAGAKIGNGAVIGAGAVVSKRVEPYQIVGGVPARPLRARFEPGIAERLEALAWWDWPHGRLAEAIGDFRSLTVEAFLEKHGG
ncbi:LbetaH domain-containing protein [Geminicoccus roseus]|uniref:chloramphenicol acetyltransferase n=1 Tax=Geminicoccus roseus TaxID=404900 RepID=UPI00041A4859|nr:chloramphenicol acetyltransferase [Geminicoccus roseus]